MAKGGAIQEHVGLVEREMPKAKAKAKAKTVRPKAKPQLDRYVYLPTDLQRAAVFMDRGDFLRKLQKSQRDREYKHFAVQGPPPLSADGAKDLQEKLAALNAEIAGLKRARSAPPSLSSLWPSLWPWLWPSASLFFTSPTCSCIAPPFVFAPPPRSGAVPAQARTSHRV